MFVFCSGMVMLSQHCSAAEQATLKQVQPSPRMASSATTRTCCCPIRVRPAMSVMSFVVCSWVTDRKNQINAVHLLNALELDLEVLHGLDLGFR